MADVSGVNAVTIGMSSGEAAAASGTTNRRGGVPAVETKPFGRHLVEVRRADKGMSLIACVAPSVVVSHAEDDVGLFGGERPALVIALSFIDWKHGQQSGEGAREEGKARFCRIVLRLCCHTSNNFVLENLLSIRWQRTWRKGKGVLYNSIVFTQCEFKILSLEFFMFVLAEDFDGTAGYKSPKTIIAGG